MCDGRGVNIPVAELLINVTCGGVVSHGTNDVRLISELRCANGLVGGLSAGRMLQAVHALHHTKTRQHLDAELCVVVNASHHEDALFRLFGWRYDRRV